jgi:hypothetical protein
MNTPVRQLGRVPDELYARLRDAAARAGMPFSRWAVDRLLTAAVVEKHERYTREMAAAIAETATPPAADTADTECRHGSSPPTQ